MTPISLAFADPDDRDEIYRMRHAVYALELGQHPENVSGSLTDELDRFNYYLVARIGRGLAGFVSVTPPGFGQYSIDKYFPRAALPFDVDDGLFEVRILTVHPAFRGTIVAGVLMYAAFRWVEEHGGTRIVGIGRREVVPLYERAGLRPLGLATRSGAVQYELMSESMLALRANLAQFAALMRRKLPKIDWQVAIPIERASGAFHGGASHSVLGPAPLPERRASIIAADVLDAWFPPSPSVTAALVDDPAFQSASSPPTYADELRHAIAAARGVEPASIVPGAGLSDLIFRALPRWLDRGARVLLLEPQYGEYAHVLRELIGCQVESVQLVQRADGYADLTPFRRRVNDDLDFVIVVEPNNPLGCRFAPGELPELLTRVRDDTVVWIDETYVDFVDTGSSTESFAARAANVVVGKSMSKAYALSGLRVGYLCSAPGRVASVWSATPPWNISRPAQAAAIAALGDPDYYAARYRETAGLRRDLHMALATLPGLNPRPGVANFILCDLEGVDAPTLVERSRRHGLYLRAFPTTPSLRWGAVRIAVKDGRTNQRMASILRDVLERELTGRRGVPAATVEALAAL